MKARGDANKRSALSDNSALCRGFLPGAITGLPAICAFECSIELLESHATHFSLIERERMHLAQSPAPRIFADNGWILESVDNDR